jgi:hypothetical protein
LGVDEFGRRDGHRGHRIIRTICGYLVGVLLGRVLAGDAEEVGLDGAGVLRGQAARNVINREHLVVTSRA